MKIVVEHYIEDDLKRERMHYYYYKATCKLSKGGEGRCKILLVTSLPAGCDVAQKTVTTQECQTTNHSQEF